MPVLVLETPGSTVKKPEYKFLYSELFLKTFSKFIQTTNVGEHGCKPQNILPLTNPETWTGGV